MSRVKQHRFGPGRKESLVLSTFKTRGLLKARLVGYAYIACGAGNEHRPDIEIEAIAHPSVHDTVAELIRRAHAGDAVAAHELADELETFALEDWFDPCEAEGLGEEE